MLPQATKIIDKYKDQPNLIKAEENEMVLFNFDLKGVSASGRTSCASGAAAGSHVLEALYPGSKRGAVRFSFSRYTTREKVDYAVNVLAEQFKIAA